MELTILGASGSYPTARTQCSGYLLRHEGFVLWLDAGNGTMGELQRHVALDDVGAVALSHAHPDHCADLYPFFYSILFDGRPREVYTPPGVHAKLDALIGEDSKEEFRKLLTWHEFAGGEHVEVGPFRIEAFRARHSTINNTMRISADGRTLCYSGDTGPNEHLARAAAGADLFLCEASWLNEQAGLMGPVHLAAGEAGAAGRAAGCARLALTHIWPSNDLAAARAQASEAFGREVELALELGTTAV